MITFTPLLVFDDRRPRRPSLQMVPRFVFSLVVLVVGRSCVYAQEPPKDKAPAEEKTHVTIVLAGGSPLLVDEVTEDADGYWYKRGNITTFLSRERVTRIEQPKPETNFTPPQATDRKWRLADAARVEEFFASRFKRPLPVAAFGQSELHTRWGLD